MGRLDSYTDGSAAKIVADFDDAVDDNGVVVNADGLSEYCPDGSPSIPYLYYLMTAYERTYDVLEHSVNHSMGLPSHMRPNFHYLPDYSGEYKERTDVFVSVMKSGL